MDFRIAHTNINVSDLEKSLAFYREALGLEEVRRKEADAFTLVYISDADKRYTIELTCLKDHPQRYDLGENEWHIAFATPDFDEALAKHKQMGCVCFENAAMGIYFIEDPDGYWLEVIPQG